MNPKPWTGPELARLRKMVGYELRHDEIGARLNRSVASVRHGVRTAGLSAPAALKWTPDEDERLVEMVCSGARMPEIERAMGRPQKGIRNRMWMLRLSFGARGEIAEMSQAFHQRPRAQDRLRIGAIGPEIDAGSAATRCTDFARRRGGVVVLVDTGGVCWALTETAARDARTIERQTSSVIGTFYAGVRGFGVLTAIRDGIEQRMRELGGMSNHRLHHYRLRVIRDEYAKSYGGAKRAAELLGMSHAAVRKFASRHGVATRRATPAASATQTRSTASAATDPVGLRAAGP